MAHDEGSPSTATPPESFETASSLSQSLYVRLAGFFRVTVLPQQPEEWRATLPIILLTTDEIKPLAYGRHARDEICARLQLAELRSASAGIVTFLNLAREIRKEASNVLR